MTFQIHTSFSRTSNSSFFFFLVASDLVILSAGRKKYYASELCLLISFSGFVPLTNSVLHGFCIKWMLTESQSLRLTCQDTASDISRAAGFCQVTRLRQKKTKEQGSTLEIFEVSEVQVADFCLGERGEGLKLTDFLQYVDYLTHVIALLCCIMSCQSGRSSF